LIGRGRATIATAFEIRDAMTLVDDLDRRQSRGYRGQQPGAG